MTKLRVTLVQPDGTVREIDNVESGRSLMAVAREHGVAGILADCGGSCACATCHVLVDPEWTEAVGLPNEIEAGLLDMVEGAHATRSRLSCQIELELKLDGLRVTVVENG